MNDNLAWDDFWDREASDAAGKKGGGEGILGAFTTNDATQRKVWAEFARKLPKNARILDLATGDGRVMTYLLAARRDLKPVGTDRASRLPDAPRGTLIKAGVLMEKLPFPDGRFAAVTSQFGFEYGDTTLAAGEIGRVLTPGGKCGLMVHRGDGPILAHNIKRREAILWALDQAEVIERARRGLAIGPAVLTGLAHMVGGIADEGAQAFGSASPAWEIAEAVRRTILLGARQDPRSIGSTLKVIESKARNEVARIGSLEGACTTADERGTLVKHLENAGLGLEKTLVVTESSGAAFADFLCLTKPH